MKGQLFKLDILNTNCINGNIIEEMTFIQSQNCLLI